MSENDTPTFSAICARWTSRHPIALLYVALAVTVVAACGLTRIEFQTRIDDFRHPESKALIRTVDADFREGNHLSVIFESKHAQVSLLEPRMLQQQFRVMQAIVLVGGLAALGAWLAQRFKASEDSGSRP